MEVQIIKGIQEAKYYPVSEDVALAVSKGDRTIGELVSSRYTLIYIKENRKEEIMPHIAKYPIWEIRNTKPGMPYLYVTDCLAKEKGWIKVHLYRYDCKVKQFEIVYTAEEEMVSYPSQKKVTIFVLDENYLLIQTSYLRSNGMESYQGFLDFELTLFGIREQKQYPVTDDYLLQAGIEDMRRINGEICVIKTGYNLVEDNRYTCFEESDAVAENIGFINCNQLISDIIMKQQHIYLNIVDQVCYHQSLFGLKVFGEIIVYSRLNFKKETEEIIFVDCQSGETRACINCGISKQISNPCILGGNPYIMAESETGTHFYNILKGKHDFHLGKGIKVKKITGEFLITQEQKKGRVFKRPYALTSVYQYPNLNTLVREKETYADAFSPAPGKLYLFTGT